MASTPEVMTLEKWTKKLVDRLKDHDEAVGKHKAASRERIETTIALGRELQRIKGSVSHGDWGRLFERDELEDFDIDQNMAARLIRIAKHPVIGDKANWNRLPPSLNTLYQLSRVPEKQLQSLLDKKLLTSDMSKREAEELAKPHEKKALPPPKKDVADTNDDDEDELTSKPTQPRRKLVEEPTLVQYAAKRLNIEAEDLDEDDEADFQAHCKKWFKGR